MGFLEGRAQAWLSPGHHRPSLLLILGPMLVSGSSNAVLENSSRPVQHCCGTQQVGPPDLLTSVQCHEGIHPMLAEVSWYVAKTTQEDAVSLSDYLRSGSMCGARGGFFSSRREGCLHRLYSRQVHPELQLPKRISFQREGRQRVFPSPLRNRHVSCPALYVPLS